MPLASKLSVGILSLNTCLSELIHNIWLGGEIERKYRKQEKREESFKIKGFLLFFCRLNLEKSVCG